MIYVAFESFSPVHVGTHHRITVLIYMNAGKIKLFGAVHSRSLRHIGNCFGALEFIVLTESVERDYLSVAVFYLGCRALGYIADVKIKAFIGSQRAVRFKIRFFTVVQRDFYIAERLC